MVHSRAEDSLTHRGGPKPPPSTYTGAEAMTEEVMICGQKDCDEAAVYHLFWPGRPPLASCDGCKQKAEGIAENMGFDLRVEKDIPDVDYTPVAKDWGHTTVVLDEKPRPKEMVDHPDHYGGKDNPYETIKVLEHTMTREEFIGFLKGNVFKYNDRANKKDNPVQDYGKAAWYQNYLTDFLKRSK